MGVVVTSPVEAAQFIRFQLDHLTARNEHHAFEWICFWITKRRLSGNLLPATGPVSAGGDQGRDAETYSVWLPSGTPDSDGLAGRAVTGPLVMACSAQKNGVAAKVRADVSAICGRGKTVHTIAFFSVRDIPVATRHLLEEEARQAHGVQLLVFDGQAIAHMLIEDDLVWIAREYLHLPPHLLPDSGQYVPPPPMRPTDDDPSELDDLDGGTEAEDGPIEWDVTGARYSIGDQYGDHSETRIRPAPRDQPQARSSMGRVPQIADCYQDRAIGQRITKAALTTAAAPDTQVLTGLGGTGKTQLAAHYAAQALDSGQVDLLIWATADHPDTIRACYEQAARALAGFEGDDRGQAAQWFLDWLRGTDRRWLVVLDDLVHPADLIGLRPPRTANGMTIVTTRRTAASVTAREGVTEVRVDGFSPTESRSYLEAKLAGHPELADDLEGLAADFENLPLGLAMAVSYMLDRDMPASRYRERLAETEYPSELLPDDDEPPDSYPGTLAAILNLDLADQLKPEGVASPLLLLLSLLAPSGIPETVLTAPAIVEYLRRHRTSTTGAPVTEHTLRDALHCLRKLNLVQLNAGTASVRVHTVVRRCARERAVVTARDDIGTAITAAAWALVEAWPEFETDALLAQALRDNTAALVRDSGWDAAATAHPLLDRMGRSLAASGDPAGALPYVEKLLAARTRLLGPGHPDTHAARASLASCRGRCGDITRAVADFEALLAEQSQLLTPDDPLLLNTRSRLAAWHGRAGHVAYALTEFKSLVTAYADVYGPDSPETWRTRASLATSQGRSLDRAGEAATLTRLLADQVRSVGAEHPLTLSTRAALAAARGRGGDAAGALKAHEELVADLVKILGPDHPDTFRARVMSARWRGWTGDQAGAVAELRAVIDAQRASLGPGHPSVRDSLAELMTWRLRGADPELEAVDAAVAQLTQQVRDLGPYHRDTLATRDILCQVSDKAGRSRPITAALRELLAAQVQSAGEDHPDALGTRMLLALRRGRHNGRAGALQSADAIRDVLAERVRVLGNDHADVLATRIWLARMLSGARDYAAAAHMQDVIVSEHRRLFGHDHPGVLKPLAHSVRLHTRAGHVLRVYAALARLRDVQSRLLGPEAPETLGTRFSIAKWIGEAGDARRAVKLHESLLADRLRLLGPDHRDTLTSRWHVAYWWREAGDKPRSIAALEELLAAQRQFLEAGHGDIAWTEECLAWWRAKPPRSYPPVEGLPRSAASWQEVGDEEKAFFRAAASDTTRPSAAALIEALALSAGRGAPRADGVWRLMAEALAEGAPVTESDIDGLLTAAGPFITADNEDGQVIYRITNPHVRDAVLRDVGRGIGLRQSQILSLRHGQLSRALLTNFSLNPYLVKRLPQHIAAAGEWETLAKRHHRLLDELDPEGIASAVLQASFGNSRLPAEITQISRSWPALAENSPDFRSIARRMWSGGRIYRAGFHNGRQGRWRLKWATYSDETPDAPSPGIPLKAHTPPSGATPLSAIASISAAAGAGPALIIAADREGTLTAWAPPSLDPISMVHAHVNGIESMTPIRLSGETTLLATAGHRELKIWDPADLRAAVRAMPVESSVRAMTTVPGEDQRRVLLAVAGDDGTLQLWDPLTGLPACKRVQCHDAPINAIITIPKSRKKGTLIATASDDGKVRFWHPATLTRDRTNIVPRCGPLSSLALIETRELTLLAIGCADGGIGLWDMRSRLQRGETLRGHTGNVRMLAAVSRTGTKSAVLVSGDSNGTLQLWDAYHGAALGHPMTGHTGPITGITTVPVATVPNRYKNLLATCGGDASPRIWNLPYTKKRDEDGITRRHVTAMESVEAGPGEARLVTGRADGAVELLDPATGQAAGPTLTASTGPVTALAVVKLASGATRIATAGDRSDGTLKFWDPDSGQVVAETNIRNKRGINAITTTVTIADPDRGTQIVTGHANGSIVRWDAEDGKPLRWHVLCHHDQLACMTAIPREDRPPLLATGDRNGELRIWDPRTGEECPQPTCESRESILSLGTVMTADGRSLLAVGRNAGRPVEFFDTSRWQLAGTARLDRNTEFQHFAGLPTAAAEYLIAVGADRIDVLDATTDWSESNKFVLADEILRAHAFGSRLAVATRTGLSLLELSNPDTPVLAAIDTERR